MLRRAIAAGTLALSAACVSAASPPTDAPAPVPTVTIALHPALDRPSTQVEGWGTALAWFAEVTGGWPEADRRRLADLFYGRDGLGWTIARFNIGGGNAADTPPYLHTGAAIPGFWRQPPDATGRDWWHADDARDWNPDADPRQRWWLDAVRTRVAHPVFEAFSNSPPWFMTVSGRVSGAEKGGDDNLRAGFEPPFASYLAHAIDTLQRRHGIRFRTLSPVNEPDTDYWHATNRQEGSHWGPTRQAAMIVAADAALRERGLDTFVAAPDETSSQLFLTDWQGWSQAARRTVGQLNVHSYGTVHQTGVRDIARMRGTRLWMSENDTPMPGDPEDFASMTSPLAFAEHVVNDLKHLEPAAWIFWQAVEDLNARDGVRGSNWGLVKADLRAPDEGPHPLHVTAKYWTMAQFSRFIRPGDRLVPVDDADTVGALSPDGRRLVLVHVNGGLVARRLVLPAGWRAQMILTDADHQAAAEPGTVVPPQSVATLVMTRSRTGRR